MTPRLSWRSGLSLVASLLLLNASLSFENLWPTPAIVWRGAFSVELAVCVFAFALMTAAGVRLSSAGLAAVSAVWTLLVFGRYAVVTAPALYGRDVNLYWDLRFIPDVAAMVARAAPWWLLVLSAAAAACLLVVLYRVVRFALRTVADAMAIEPVRRQVGAIAMAAIVLFGIRERIHPDSTAFTEPVTVTLVRQIGLVIDALTGSKTLPPTPPMQATLDAVRGADVFVVFIESYGAIAYDRPEIAARLDASRRKLAGAVAATGRHAVSGFVRSPTFGGSSWLAHVSLLSGIEVREPDTNARLMTQHRDTLVRAFARNGFRTVALMPGLRQRWPEGSFYGFDEIYGADRLAYRGPEFGWFAIPDEYSLERLNALEIQKRDRPPLFVFFPTISTHFPFRPTPPYQPDWTRMTDEHPFSGPDIVRAYARQPDWTDFSTGYVEAMQYDFDVLAGFLSLVRDRDIVMLLVGDHQPPAAVSGEHAPWDVPVHVIANREEILDAFVERGFADGLLPRRPVIAPMNALAPIVIAAFSRERAHDTIGASSIAVRHKPRSTD